MRNITRRQFASAATAFSAGVLASTSIGRARIDELPPARTITRGPKHHWFGYYDKLEFDPTDRYVLSNQVDFEHRTPTADDSIRVGMIDTRQGDEWIELGSSRAWGWQQGCMLQWRPKSRTEVVWNDRQEDRFVCRIMDVETKQTRTLPRPVYTLSNDGRWALTADFARIQRMRPGYGYVGLPDPHHGERAPEDSGVWRMDMNTGESRLIFSLADAAAIDDDGTAGDYFHYFNHILVNPDDSRFIVLHRKRRGTGRGADARPTGGFVTRMFTVAMDGSERYVLDPSGHTSHFIWRDPTHVCAWTRPAGKEAAFYVFKDRSRELEIVGRQAMRVNGHNTYLPDHDNEWILNDTYPERDTRQQTPYLFHVPSGRRFDLGHFRSPPEYVGEWRCDLHPRSDNAGLTVAIDSPHGGQGRQVHLIDVREIVA